MNYYIAITKGCSFNISYIYVYSRESHKMLVTRRILRCINKKLSKRFINSLIYFKVNDAVVFESGNPIMYFGSLDYFGRWVVSLLGDRIVQMYEV